MFQVFMKKHELQEGKMGNVKICIQSYLGADKNNFIYEFIFASVLLAEVRTYWLYPQQRSKSPTNGYPG